MLRFLALTALVSAGLSALWIASDVSGPLSATALTAIASVSIMAASRGHSASSKAVYIAVTLGGWVAIEALSRLSGLGALAYSTPPSTVLGVAARLLEAVKWGFPIAMLVLFVGKEPARLWTKR